MTTRCQVAIIGAGPYGLSIAAHLRHRGVPFRIFGIPMQTWETAMPKRMLLTSDLSASNLSDPARLRTMERYCRENGFPELLRGAPIPVSAYVDYGLAFQREAVPELEEVTVVSLRLEPRAFDITLFTGERVIAQRVVLALGTTYFKHMPDPLADLPSDLASHTSDHNDLSVFARREVVIIGGGQSALETAALLDEQGAKVRLIVRPPRIHAKRLPDSQSGLGKGVRLWLSRNAQQLFQYLPEDLRLELVRYDLVPPDASRPASRVLERLAVLEGHVVRDARVQGDRVCLSVTDRSGRLTNVSADHVIAATGFKVDLNAIRFLDYDLARRLERIETAPALSRTFESSVPGLYFVGLSAASRFGPSMRFVLGADYTARRLGSALSLAVRHPKGLPASHFRESVPS